MNEIDNGPLSNEELAKAAVLGVFKIMAIKWAVIYFGTRALRKALENKAG